MTITQFFKNFFYFLSPFSLLITFSFVGVLLHDDKYHTERWTNQAAAMFLPAFFILGTLYAIIRLVLKEQVLWIWVVETIILFLIYYLVFT
jgi:hypothetical protein